MKNLARLLTIILLGCLFSVSPFWLAEATPQKSTAQTAKVTITYVVKKGDSLDKIAKQYGVPVNDIVRWNNLSDASRIQIGQKLKIRVPKGSAAASAASAASTGGSSGTKSGGDTRAAAAATQDMFYIVKKGDTLGKIARKTGVSAEQLKKHNPDLRKNPDRLRVGQKLVLEVNRFSGQTGVSRGLANNGSLVGGIQLPAGSGYIVRNPKRSYGTALTVGIIMDAMADYARKYPKGPRYTVGDLSAEKGGRLVPHLSHQSGRDVDISYISKHNKENAGFARMNASNFDAEKNWHLLEYFIKTGKVQYIFVDYDLQKLLYEQAKKQGYTDSQLKGIMQYPNGRKSYHAIIRHAKGHADHSHVRFVCAGTDVNCH
ncbi:MAG: penicillin-insensitive murein endopeptidase [Proteobacteria bacterium]|nr:penicillin-insensitive murein endopeptidase [Pseudomonadota bacterium]